MADGAAIGPSTDNFAICTFEIEGVRYHSAEHAYQALKMKSPKDKAKVAACEPKKGENSWDYGMRVWNLGQRLPKRKDWEQTKVRVMHQANKAKLEQNPILAAELCNTVGVITHRGSGDFWDKWNPILLMLIREELRGEAGDPTVLRDLQGKMGLL